MIAAESKDYEYQVLNIIIEHTRLSKNDIQRILNVSFVVVKRTMDSLERCGSVCRDESLSGVFFYSNTVFGS